MFCIQLHNIIRKKTEPLQYISICFQKEKLFHHFDLTDLVEHDVIDMLIFLLFGVLCMLERTEGKLISLFIITFSCYNTDILKIRKQVYA